MEDEAGGGCGDPQQLSQFRELEEVKALVREICEKPILTHGFSGGRTYSCVHESSNEEQVDDDRPLRQ